MQAASRDEGCSEQRRPLRLDGSHRVSVHVARGPERVTRTQSARNTSQLARPFTRTHTHGVLAGPHGIERDLKETVCENDEC